MSLWAEAMRQRVLKDLQCPICHEQNAPSSKPMIDLDETGAAYCNSCGHTWDVPKPYAVPR